MAITVQIFAGGSLIYLLTGIPLTIIMPLLLIIALIYTYISGLEASIVTDFVQIAMIVVIGAIILPLTWAAAGGASARCLPRRQAIPCFLKRPPRPSDP